MRFHYLLAVGAFLIASSVTPTQTVAQDAASLYKKSCVACHGATGKGDGPAATAMNPRPPDMTDAKRMAGFTDAKLAEVIGKGSKGMPGFGSMLKPADVKALVAYIQSLSEKKPPK